MLSLPRSHPPRPYPLRDHFSTGRIDEAEIEFGKALAIDPNLHSAEYNLGIIYQQNLRNLDLALTHYRRVLEMHEFTPGSVPLSLLKEVKIRECDLLERLSVMDDYVEEEGYDEMMCWKTGHEMFPDSSTIANELGNAFVEVRSEIFFFLTFVASREACTREHLKCMKRRQLWV
jgi:tetratricopeptide (TPR) repeat protein